MRYFLSRANWRRHGRECDDTAWQGPLAIGACILFAISAWHSFVELRYMAFSKLDDAEVIRTFTDRPIGRYGRRGTPIRVVEYRFDDSGRSRVERDQVSLAYPVPETGNIAIHYFPGVPRGSRLAGNRNYWSVLCFAVASLAGIFVVVRAWRESEDFEIANEPMPKKRRRLQRPERWSTIR